MTLDDSPKSNCHPDQVFPAHSRAPLQSIPYVLQRFLLVILCMVVLCFGVETICHVALHLHYPYDSPLLLPPSFSDFEAYFDQFHRLHSPSFFEGPYLMLYPAPVVVFYRFFYAFQPMATLVFLSCIVLSVLLGAILVARALLRSGLALRPTAVLVGGTLLLAYPFWFEFKQANMEIVVWIILGLALVTFSKDRHWTAAGLIGAVGALKFYPIIYLGLLLARKRYRECVFGCIIAAYVFLISLWFVGPTIPIAWHGTQMGLAQLRRDYLLRLRPNEMGFDHSLFSLVKYIVALLHHRPFSPRSGSFLRPALLPIYSWSMAAAGTILFFLRIRFLPVANQLLCLCVASILFTPMSFDYTLVHLYAPWTLLALLSLQTQREGLEIRGLLPTFILLALSLGPLGEFIFRQDRFGGALRAIFLLLLFVCGLVFPFAPANRDAPGSGAASMPGSPEGLKLHRPALL